MHTQDATKDTRIAPLDDRVLTLLDKALCDLATTQLVAIEIGAARRQLREWRRNARRYEIVESLAPDEMRTLVQKLSNRNASLNSLVDAVEEQRRVDRARTDFLKQQGYWAALVGPIDADEWL
ncbi:transposase-like protein [Paraburkholderia sp. GAS41]|jgi:transposase-like protein|uniref:hypothetical protein n=1 Tax=Paraburkholderia sp. GAS41 TaxID=3035134 RepID=UPI003D1BBE7C